MSDTPQGPDWWQASDDRWYPPPRPQMPGDPEPAPASAPADAGLPPPAAPATGGAYPPSGQAAAPAMAPPGQPSAPPFPPPGPGGGPPMGPAARPPFPPPPGYGPSGYPSGVAPGGGGSNPTALYVAVAVVVLAAVVGLVVVLASRSGGGGSPTSATTTNTSAQPATTAGRDPGETTGAISGVKVAESGFSTYQGFSGTAGSYGVVITNTGREPVTNFTVKIAIYDKSDTVIGSHPQTVAKLAPGQKLGIGSSITDDLSGGIGKLTVSFEEGFGTAVPEGAFTVSDVAMKTTDFGNDVSFKVASSYREDLENIASFAIFRDAGGKIVGGANGYVALVPAGGRANGTVSAFDVIPTAKRADVYVDKGFF